MIPNVDLAAAAATIPNLPLQVALCIVIRPVAASAFVARLFGERVGVSVCFWSLFLRDRVLLVGLRENVRVILQNHFCDS